MVFYLVFLFSISQILPNSMRESLHGQNRSSVRKRRKKDQKAAPLRLLMQLYIFLVVLSAQINCSRTPLLATSPNGLNNLLLMVLHLCQTSLIVQSLDGNLLLRMFVFYSFHRFGTLYAPTCSQGVSLFIRHFYLQKTLCLSKKIKPCHFLFSIPICRYDMSKIIPSI